MPRFSVPINQISVKVHETGLNTLSDSDDERSFRDLIRKSFYFPNLLDCDKNRFEDLLLAIEFENLSSDSTDYLKKKNVEIERHQPSPNKDIKKPRENIKANKEAKAQFKFFCDVSPRILKNFSTLRLQIGSWKSILCEIKSCDGTNVFFDPRPGSQPLMTRISYDVSFMPNDLSLSLGYEAIRSLAGSSLRNFFLDFTAEGPECDRILFENVKVLNNREFSPEWTPCSSGSESEIEKFNPVPSYTYDVKSSIEINSWMNANIEQNIEQQTAVKRIVNCSSQPFPFVVFGPPGTGKTSVLVEAVAQIIKLKPQSKILITAQSNSACDEICVRLLDLIGSFNQNAISRLYSSALFTNGPDESKIPDRIRCVSNYPDGFDEDRNFNSMDYNAVISTLVTSVRASSKFDYIFIDECASATEPEVMIPIMKFGVAKMSKARWKVTASIVLFGDHKQLGPVLKSNLSEKLGLGVSLMERIMSKKLYQSNPSFNSDYVVQLLDNYRSHPAILHFSNTKFYDSKLRSMMSELEQNWASEWKYLINKSIPVVFHSTREPNRVDHNNSSFNQAESIFVQYYVSVLLKDGIGNKVITPSDIGIVTPYKAQIKVLKQAFRNVDIEIGSTEYYQGREKNIIIISTVKSQSSVGFLNNQKRLNVMMTRAKHLLIVVGNPSTLATDQHWKPFVEFCYNNELFYGKGFEPSTGSSTGTPTKRDRPSDDNDDDRPRKHSRRYK